MVPLIGRCLVGSIVFCSVSLCASIGVRRGSFVAGDSSHGSLLVDRLWPTFPCSLFVTFTWICAALFLKYRGSDSAIGSLFR